MFGAKESRVVSCAFERQQTVCSPCRQSGHVVSFLLFPQTGTSVGTSSLAEAHSLLSKYKHGVKHVIFLQEKAHSHCRAKDVKAVLNSQRVNVCQHNSTSYRMTDVLDINVINSSLNTHVICMHYSITK